MRGRDPWLIQPFSVDHVRGVLNLYRRTEHVGLDESDTPDKIRQFLGGNPGLSFVAIMDEAVIGAVMAGHDTRRGYVYHLAVAKQYRRRGVGRALINRTLDALKRQGVHKCHMHMYANNENGALFWKRAGWALRDDVLIFSKFTE